MPRNVYFSQGNLAEQHLFEDIQIEALKIYGQETYYLPRKIVTRDMILNEDRESLFDDAYMVEMYIEDIEGFGGEGNLMSKFGIEIRDEVTFVVARRTWNKLVGIWNNTIDNFRPNEGDLIYLPLSNSLFEISFVEHEQPFYQLQNLPTYKLQCRLFEYNDEDFRTGINELDNIETIHADILSMLIRDITGDIELNTRLYQYFPSTEYNTLVARKVSLPGLITDKQTTITETELLISNKENQISSLESAYSSLQPQISSLQSQLYSYQPGSTGYIAIQSQISSLQSQATGLQTQIADAQSELVTLNSSLTTAKSEKDILQAELDGIDSDIVDAFDAMPYISGIITEQDAVGGTIVNRTIYITDFETNTTDLKEFYISTASDSNTYITTATTHDEYIAQTVSAEIYEIYDLDDNTDRTFENDDAAQNFDFEQTADDIIDFSEQNPFGEPN